MGTKFLRRCAADVRRVRELLERFCEGDESAGLELEHLIHRMAGTGAVLGFGPLSARAANLERFAEAHAHGGVVDAAAAGTFLHNVKLLEVEIECQSRQCRALCPADEESTS